MVSNLTGALADPQEITRAEYWVRHVRRPSATPTASPPCGPPGSTPSWRSARRAS
ncbi:hypothetical protein V2I01_30900 [Micromonospora sp. BRA006-A]|nr:hypothetical protein [Micromonospora sp. BRA006-A]